MNLIAAADSGWGIGYRGELLVRIREDLRLFSHLTSGKTVVAGARTLATFPGGRVLPGRTNLVLSRNPAYAPEGAVMVRDIRELLTRIADAERAARSAACAGAGCGAGDAGNDDVYVIGGGSVYRQLLPYCTHAYITKIEADFQKDTFLPDLDADPDWKCVFAGPVRTSREGDTLGRLANGETPAQVRFRFTVYRNENVRRTFL